MTEAPFFVDTATFSRYLLTRKPNVGRMKGKSPWQKKIPCRARWPKKRESAWKAKTRIVQMLLKCGLFLQREMNRACGRFGLKQQQFSVLNEIVWHGPISQKGAGGSTFFSKNPTFRRSFAFCRRKNLIAVSVAPGDRRMTLLSETVEGRGGLEKLHAGFFTNRVRNSHRNCPKKRPPMRYCS